MNKPDSATPIFFGFQFPHHGDRAAFAALAHELAQRGVKVKRFPYPAFPRYIPGRIRSRLACAWFRMNEYRVAGDFIKGRAVYYYFPENSAFRAGQWRKRGGRLLLTCHQPATPDYLDGIRVRSPGFYRALEAADDIILYSAVGISLYQLRFPHAHIHAVPYGVYTSFFIRKDPYLPPPPSSQTLRILTVGNWLRDYCLWAKVIAAISRFRSVEATVIANRETVKQAQCQAAALGGINCRFLSGISNEELKDEYQRAHLFFLPLTDAWSNTALLEAMSMGVPIAVTDLPATREYVGDAEAVFFRNDDASAVAQEILALCANPADCMRRSDLSRRRAETSFDWPIIAKKYYELYTETP